MQDHTTVDSIEQSGTVPSTGQANGGIGRLAYILGMLFTALLYILLATFVEQQPAGALAGLFLAASSSLALSSARYINIGGSLWWAVFILVPPASLWIILDCISLPPGAGRTHKIDTAGGVILYLFAVLSIIGLAIVFY